MGQEREITQLGRFFVEAIDKFITDNLALLLRVGDTGQLAHETIPRINLHHMNIEFADKGFHYALRFTFAEQAVVNEHTGQLITDRPVNQHRHYRGVYTAAEGAEHFFVADFVLDILDGILNKGFHRPFAFTAANLVQEVRDHLIPVHGVAYLRMELHREEFAVCMTHCRNRSTLCAGIKLESCWKLHYMIAVAHPNGLTALQSGSKDSAHFKVNVGLAVFPLVRTFYLSALLVGHKLHTIANPENWQTQIINSRIHMRCILSVNTAWSPGENNPLR